MRVLKKIVSIVFITIIMASSCNNIARNKESDICIEKRIWEMIDCNSGDRGLRNYIDTVDMSSYTPYASLVEDSLLRSFSLHFKKIDKQIYVRGKAERKSIMGVIEWDKENNKVSWEKIMSPQGNKEKSSTKESSLDENWILLLINSSTMELKKYDSFYDELCFKDENGKEILIFRSHSKDKYSN